MVEGKHNWVIFYNPRNGKVRITACANCGIAKDNTTIALPCADLPSSQHRMKRMGWQELPKID